MPSILAGRQAVEEKDVASMAIRNFASIENDGKVDIYDAMKLAKHLRGNANGEKIYHADVDGNGSIDENDVNAICNIIAYGKIQKPTGIAEDINGLSLSSVGRHLANHTKII